jgi:CRISP-associated protein Cas1
MLNEYVYCPRLAHLMWVQAEFDHNPWTLEGALKHRHVDKAGRPLAEPPRSAPSPDNQGRDHEPEPPPSDFPNQESQAREAPAIHARSVSLASEILGIAARLDLVEGRGTRVAPVDYKRGKRPHISRGVYDPERVQLCAQGLLLQEHGFQCDHGVIYFIASRERVYVEFDAELVRLTLDSIEAMQRMALEEQAPPPLEDSPKCPHCSLAGICLPDEVAFLNRQDKQPRPIVVGLEKALPLYVQSHKAWLRKDGMRALVEEDRKTVAAVPLAEISQLAVFGNAHITGPLLRECFARDIPVTFCSYGGWFMGHTVGTGHKNVAVRAHQFRAAFDAQRCLALARELVAAKIANSRTMVRRNWRDAEGASQGAPPELLAELKQDMHNARQAQTLESLLGIEGSAAGRYFRNFARMLESDEGRGFDITGRNRRPPKDPVNALLSFAYAMLVREWSVALSAVGLDPYQGFYHQPRFGRPALSLDMMEPFRPLVADSVVLTAINNREVRPEHFIHAAGSCTLAEAGRKRFIAAFERRLRHEVTHPIFGYKLSYRRLLEVQSRLLVRYLAGEIPDYPCFTTR